MSEYCDFSRAEDRGNSPMNTSFPCKLHYMLSELEHDSSDDIIHWQPHGRAFMILERKRLETEILPL